MLKKHGEVMFSVEEAAEQNHLYLSSPYTGHPPAHCLYHCAPLAHCTQHVGLKSPHQWLSQLVPKSIKTVGFDPGSTATYYCK